MSSPSAPRRAVLFGSALFVLGLVFILIDITALFSDHHNTALWLNLACLLAPIGFAIAVWSGLSAGRAAQREAARAAAHPAPGQDG